ncbi:ATP-binding protein [Actinoplanes friuliensis]|uniref:Transcriptional regulator n=1 Tax=Actinoplanes friuliensis DSM 7358 TaxID=1246995 RepID=U5VZW0_9ACTN|nr:AAA family ATPase [Actinoplanes friuliensis]AGZ41255.1 transcriptional regulator [Actinoplanes friuliensis DSM 7358]
MASGGLRLQILGPLRVRHEGSEPATFTGQQACLLALLLAREQRPISAAGLIDLIWGDDVPASALNILHKYIGALRRLLEPGLPAREPGSYLVRRGHGYLIEAVQGTSDLADFRAAVAVAETAQQPEAALDAYLEALALWHGPAADGLECGPAAAAMFAALDGDFFDTCEAAARVAVSAGRPQRVLRPLRLAAAMAPLHEPVQASLVDTLAAAGQQADALLVFDAVRNRLRDELGITPGPALQAAHQRVLAEAPATGGVRPGPGGTFVGRADELATLRQAVTAALGGGTGFVLVEGEPGSGKTRLLEEATDEAGRRGVFTAWGKCLPGDGTPAMWPWVQAIGAVLDGLPTTTRRESLAGELGRITAPHTAVRPPDEGTQFRLFEQVVAVVGQAAARCPVLLVIDDLQWADAASLRLFGHLATRLPGATAVVGLLRDSAPVPDAALTGMLAAAGRVPGHRRIRLGPLSPDDVAQLVSGETGQDAGPAVARSIHTRTAGNAFLVRELARLLADGGEVTPERTEVPATVRDIVRDRMAGLDQQAGQVLRIAALLGRDVDVRLLAAAAGLDGETCLARLELLTASGLLTPVRGDPFSFRFAHDLVRESVVAATPPLPATRMHLRIADALQGTAAVDESVAERFAHHLWAAGPLADPARTADALVRAGGHAAAKSAFDAAERHLQSAAQLARAAGLAESELSALSQLIMVAGMRSGYSAAAPGLLKRAEHLARGLGRERQATEFLFSRRAAHSQAAQLQHSGRLAHRLLQQGERSGDPVVRAYGLHAWGIHQWDIGNVGEAFRHLSRSNQTMVDDLARRDEQPLRHDLRLLSAGMLAETTALHGDVGAARGLLDTLEATAGDDPYAVTVWAAFSARVAAMVGDPVWALRVAERGIAEDPGFSYTFFGAYLRLARWWARAVTGVDPAGAATEAEAVITTVLLDPPRSNLPTWYALLAEMWLAAGRVDDAAKALDRADEFLEAHGQRYAEGLLLLVRARLLRARGEPDAAVRAAAGRARTRSVEREAHLFADRADALLASLAEPAEPV